MGFYTCSICGKKLIRRKHNGLWVFRFGRGGDFTPVEMLIFGHIKMRCIRRRCRKENPDHWNEFTLFPKSVKTIGQKSNDNEDDSSESGE